MRDKWRLDISPILVYRPGYLFIGRDSKNPNTEGLMRRLFLMMAILIALIAGAVLPAAAANDFYDRQMAMDLAWELAHPEREIQRHGSGNRHYQNLLTVLVTGVQMEEDFLNELVEEWHQRNDQDRLDAIDWCLEQRDTAADDAVSEYWHEKATYLVTNTLVYQSGSIGVPFWQMRAWGYFYRFYDRAKYVPDHWTGGPRPTRSWTPIQREYR